MNILSLIEVFNSIPKGWVITDGCSNAPRNYKFISNNKSRFKPGRKIGLIKIIS